MASDFSIRHAAHIVRQGGIIAYPTDTIYGLGCDPYNHDAVERLNHIKQRSADKQFILLAGHIEQLKSLLLLTDKDEKNITQNIEATSWVVEAKPGMPQWLLGNRNTLTVRISKHPDVIRLCHALGYAIISTSANPVGKPPAENALELHKYFQHEIDKIILSNKKLAGRASKIIRLCDNHVIRQ